MNRAARRRAKRQSVQKPTYNLTAKEIADIRENAKAEATQSIKKSIKEGSKDAVGSAFCYMIGLSLMAGTRMFNWSKKTCNDFVLKMIELYNDSVTDDIEALAAFVEMKSGIKVELTEGEKKIWEGN